MVEDRHRVARDEPALDEDLRDDDGRFAFPSVAADRAGDRAAVGEDLREAGLARIALADGIGRDQPEGAAVAQQAERAAEEMRAQVGVAVCAGMERLEPIGIGGGVARGDRVLARERRVADDRVEAGVGAGEHVLELQLPVERRDADRRAAERALPLLQPRPAGVRRGEYASLHVGEARVAVALGSAGEEGVEHRVGDEVRARECDRGGAVAAFLRGIGRDLGLRAHQPAQFRGGVDPVADDRLDEAVLLRHAAPGNRDDVGVGQADEAVAAPQHAVEEGEFMRARQRFEPQRQFGEVDRERVAVDAAQAVLRDQPLGMEQLVLVRRDRRALRGPARPGGDEPLAQLAARLDQERARAGGGVADLEVEHVGGARVGAEAVESGGERVGDDRLRQRARRVVAAGAAALVGRLQHGGVGGNGDAARAGAQVGDGRECQAERVDAVGVA